MLEWAVQPMLELEDLAIQALAALNTMESVVLNIKEWVVLDMMVLEGLLITALVVQLTMVLAVLVMQASVGLVILGSAALVNRVQLFVSSIRRQT